MFVKLGGVLLLDLKKLLVKLVKKIARETNFIAIVEKRGDFYYHNDITEVLCKSININPQDIIGKSLTELYDKDLAKFYREKYKAAWHGKELGYIAIDPSGSDQFYVVLTPIFLNGKVNRIMLSLIELDKIPAKLRIVI